MTMAFRELDPAKPLNGMTRRGEVEDGRVRATARDPARYRSTDPHGSFRVTHNKNGAAQVRLRDLINDPIHGGKVVARSDRDMSAKNRRDEEETPFRIDPLSYPKQVQTKMANVN